MKLEIVAVKDRALDAFGRPFYVQTIGQAIRSFQDEVNNKESEIHKHPEDYDLYHLGTWNDDTGQFTNNQPPMQICIGKQAIIN